MKATVCLACDDEGTMKAAGVNELQWQKCVGKSWLILGTSTCLSSYVSILINMVDR